MIFVIDAAIVLKINVITTVCKIKNHLKFYIILGQQTTVSPIGPDELPPPFYQAPDGGGVPMVTCRVCQAMIDISGKRDQHVVKCSQCNEATVSTLTFYF